MVLLIWFQKIASHWIICSLFSSRRLFWVWSWSNGTIWKLRRFRHIFPIFDLANACCSIMQGIKGFPFLTLLIPFWALDYSGSLTPISEIKSTKKCCSLRKGWSKLLEVSTRGGQGLGWDGILSNPYSTQLGQFDFISNPIISLNTTKTEQVWVESGRVGLGHNLSWIWLLFYRI